MEKQTKSKSSQYIEQTIPLDSTLLTPSVSHTDTNELEDTSDENVISASNPDKDVSSSSSLAAPHTIYTDPEKYLLVFLTASIAIWSSLGSPIYYPALQTIRDHFQISDELVNISIVVYMLSQGISPSLISPFADKFGRRPVLLGCLIGFVGSSVGLAVINNYTALLILRCMQSGCISSSVPIASGVVGDFTTRANRGGFVLLSGAITFLGQAFGALIGSILIEIWNWRAIFWFLAIAGVLVFIVSLIMLPETKRSIAGNGTVIPKCILNRALILSSSKIQKKWRLNDPDSDTLEPKVKLDFLSTFKILLRPELAICLLNGAIHYAIWVVLLTCLTGTLAKAPYNYSVMKIGLCYIPAGIGGLLGALLAGRVLNYVYKLQLSHHEAKIKEGSIPADTKFNIVKARVTVIIPYALLTEMFAVMYGWCLHYQLNISLVLISEFLVCLGSLALIGINSSLLIDLYPYNGSAASSSVNLTRCTTGAVFVAVLNAMENSMKLGGLFSFMAGLGLMSTGLLYVPLKWGMVWTERRKNH
ncbi:hypothetical protein WICPIJ_007105 [Wickerhamomyces pijperi]|uniref:Major facilitator superfamily (MFS) profile domain-containing protein n=1 Tax=Wickerhamomyces pijperi TaxID=599730 RepID=A0A9P8Q0I6_WICPI|nr:hypothetical protein WICPIJ_007105 [Wickerhamomyces pijperi]